MHNWPRYIDKSKNRPPRPLLVRALDFVEDKKSTLDIGAGALNDSRYLLEKGFKQVIALDKEVSSMLIKEFDDKNFIFKKCAAEDYAFPTESFDLINAQFVMPFVPKQKMDKLIKAIKKALKSRGIFTGQFFGPKDSWSNRKDTQVYSRTEVDNFLDELDILFFDEEEKDDRAAFQAMKHWHIFHFIARKK